MKPGFRFRVFVLIAFAGLMASLMKPAWAVITVQGQVTIWNPHTMRYEALRGVKVQVDFKAHWQVGDLDGWTDFAQDDREITTGAMGGYAVQKPDAIGTYDRHQVKVIVLAEIPDRLKIQDGPLPDGPYQFETTWRTVHNGGTAVMDIRLDGSDETTGRGYFVNGIWHLTEASAVPAERGRDAFHILKCISDHQEQLASGGGFVDGDFRYNWVWFPSDSGESSTSAINFINIGAEVFGSGFEIGCVTARHEATHALLRDIYQPQFYPGNTGILNGVQPNQPHLLNTVWPNQANAFNEALAAFFSLATIRRQWGNFADSADGFPNELEGYPGWCSEIEPAADRSCVEGQVAAVLWDIFDGDGREHWEQRRIQEDEIPGKEEFMDPISDPDFFHIATVLKEFQPQALTHFASGLAHGGNFINRWLSQTATPFVGENHYFKAFLFNREIEAPNFLPNRPPELIVESLQWQDLDLVLDLKIRERDAEDRLYCWLEMFIDNERVRRDRLGESWSWDGEVNRRRLRYRFPSSFAGSEVNLTVAAHDDMQSSFQKRAVRVPAPATPPHPVCARFTRLTVAMNEVMPPGLGPITARGFLVARASHHELVPATTTRLPDDRWWRFDSGNNFAQTRPETLLQTDSLAEEIRLDFEFHLNLADQRGNESSHVARKRAVLSPSNAWDYDDQVIRFPQSEERPRWPFPPSPVNRKPSPGMPPGTTVELHYRLSSCQQ